MMNKVYKDYILFVAPAVLIPIGVYLFDHTIPLLSLCKIGLLFPLLMLSMKALSGFFPSENLRDRSVGRIAEYALLQGLVFAASTVLIAGFMEPNLQSSFSAALRQFAITALFMSVFNFVGALNAQKKLRALQ